MKRRLIAANWKLNNTVPEALKFIAAFTSELKAAGEVDVVFAAPFTTLYSMSVAIADTGYKLAAQDIFWEDSGAYTGEVSGPLLVDVGCQYVIIGHSERRQHFCETDETVNMRTLAAIRNALTPIMCVGETLKEREDGRAWAAVERQLKVGLHNIDLACLADFVIAYEPVWAIGTGRTATPGQAEEMHSLIYERISTTFGAAAAETTRIIYGGSVKPSNSRELLTKPHIDGALVGAASLNPQHFAAIVRSAH